MPTYKKRTPSNVYRKIYEDNYGPIPREDDGRSYDIHHVDGDPSNNVPSNLKAVTIQEHFDIHYSQGDFGACLKIATKMKLPSDEISKLATNHNNKMAGMGVHPFQSPEFKIKNGERSRRRANKLLSDGKHNFQDADVRKNAKIKRDEVNKNKIKNGEHHLQSRGDKHPSYDHSIYTFFNSLLNETVSLTQYDFRTKFNLDSGSVNHLIKGKQKIVKGWVIIHTESTVL